MAMNESQERLRGLWICEVTDLEGLPLEEGEEFLPLFCLALFS